ncbi:MAG: hypothetical protein Q9181_006821 [Wetmoreana brouardii]
MKPAEQSNFLRSECEVDRSAFDIIIPPANHTLAKSLRQSQRVASISGAIITCIAFLAQFQPLLPQIYNVIPFPNHYLHPSFFNVYPWFPCPAFVVFPSAAPPSRIDKTCPFCGDTLSSTV